MSRKIQIIIASVLGVVGLLLILVAGKLGIIPVAGIESVFQQEGTCNTCHETWYDEKHYAFNPRGNAELPWGVTVGCAECHPVQYEEYKVSAMGNSKSPLRPGCVNCHDEPHSVPRWFKHMYLADPGWKEVQMALRDRDLYNNKLAPRLAKNARQHFVETDSKTCRECHMREDHQSVLKGTVGEYRANIPPHQQMLRDGLTCVQCHQNFMHNLSVPAPWTGKPTKAQQGKLEDGRDMSEVCVGCHGEDGNSEDAMFPSIAGFNANYTYLQLLAFRDGVRQNEMMQEIVAELDEQDMADLAAYFGTRKRRPAATVPKVLTLQQRADLETGQSLYAKLCARCHGLTARGQGILPPLAGQYADYILMQIDAFKEGTRSKHSIMRSIVDGVSEKELQLIANYIAGLKP
jgi:cytochrome c553